MMPEYIRVTDLSKVYRKHEAVKHISSMLAKADFRLSWAERGGQKHHD